MFVDGLSELFLPDADVNDNASRFSSTNTSPRSSTNTLSPADARSGSGTPPRSILAQNESSQTYLTLKSPTLAHIRDAIERALNLLNPDAASPKTLLILDQPSMLLQTASNPAITSQDMSSFFLDLRIHPSVYSTILSLPADPPLLKAAVQSANATTDQVGGLTSSPSGMDLSKLTPLEVENAATTVQAAMLSRYVMSCRPFGDRLGPSDVSGVLRVNSRRQQLRKLWK